jgi:Uma2 family endonuclease
MATAAKPISAEEFWQMQNGQRCELIDGEVVYMAPAGGEHGGVTINLTGPVWVHVTDNDLGRLVAAETGFILRRNPDRVRAADLAFICKDRVPEGGLPKKFIPFAPDLATETVSPSDTMEEVEEKVLDWFKAGTRLVWVLIPKTRTVRVYRSPTDLTILTDQDELDGGDVLPGFRLPVARIFS